MFAEGKRYDLIVSDVVMPNMDGPAMARKLRALYGNEFDLAPGVTLDKFLGTACNSGADECASVGALIFAPDNVSGAASASKK